MRTTQSASCPMSDMPPCRRLAKKNGKGWKQHFPKCSVTPNPRRTKREPEKFIDKVRRIAKSRSSPPNGYTICWKNDRVRTEIPWRQASSVDGYYITKILVKGKPARLQARHLQWCLRIFWALKHLKWKKKNSMWMASHSHRVFLFPICLAQDQSILQYFFFHALPSAAFLAFNSDIFVFFQLRLFFFGNGEL